MKHLNKYLFIIFFVFSGCQSVKDGLTGSKSKNSDEFLVEKKNPLVTPPEFDELPTPQASEVKDEEEVENELKIILGQQTETDDVKTDNKNLNQSIEKSIIEKIKNN